MAVPFDPVSVTETVVRQARTDDTDAVAAFTRDTWDRFDRGDYLPEVFGQWVQSDGPDQRTVVAERDGAVVGTCQCVALSAHEAWAQGMRVAPDHRGSGVADALNRACFDWARDRGATVCRAMVFSWNAAGLGTARGVGFDPCTEFRWAHPEPGDGVERAAPSEELTVTADPDAAWSAWQRSAARDHLRGLALDADEGWALSEVTRERLRRAADETAVFAVRGPEGTRGTAFRTRDYERDTGDESEGESEGESEAGGETALWAEYCVGAWTDVAAARALFDAVARDAGELGADETRVLVPETARHVSDVAYAGVEVSEDPDFVLEADLTGAGE